MTAAAGRILIIDDHPIVLYGLRFLLRDNARFEICGEASDAEAARELAERLRPDYVILDLVLGGRDDIGLLREILTRAPATRILVYSSQDEWRFTSRSLRAGARGYVAKSEGLEAVARALEVIAAGEIYIGEPVRKRLAEVFGATSLDPRSDGVDQLSNRELQVLRLIGQGRSSRDIAETLGLSAKTVATYYERMKIKLKIDNFRDLEAFARDHAEQRFKP